MTSLSLLDFLRETTPPEPRVWDYVSASRLNLWMKCPLAFKRRYVDGIESAPSVSLFIGKVVHAVLEYMYSRRSIGMTCTEIDLAACAAETWAQTMDAEPCFFDDEAHEEKCHQQVFDLAAAYLRDVNIETETPIAVEKRYEMPLIDPLTGEDLGLPLVGIVDLVLDEKSCPVIIDFKTAASASASCAIQHELQLTAYAYLMRQALGRDESGLEIRQLVKTKVPKIVVHRFEPRTDEHFRKFFDLVREYIDGLDRGVFNYRPGFGCMMCDQSGICCS